MAGPAEYRDAYDKTGQGLACLQGVAPLRAYVRKHIEDVG